MFKKENWYKNPLYLFIAAFIHPWFFFYIFYKQIQNYQPPEEN